MSNSTIDMIDDLYRAEALAQLLIIVADGLRNQQRLANGLGEVAGQIVEIVVNARRSLEAEIEAEAKGASHAA